MKQTAANGVTAENERSARSFVTVTELPGAMASSRQLSMATSRYRYAAELTEGRHVLEVACGSGTGLGILARSAASIVGLDLDPALVGVGRNHYNGRIDIRQGDALSLPFDDASFDAVLVLEAIYYLPDVARFVTEARRVLRPDGILHICTVNREWPGFNPSPFSVRYYSLRELSETLEAHGFSVETRVGFRVPKSSLRASIVTGARRLGSRLGLIPSTMNGKAFLKRIVFGKLTPIPPELTLDMAEYDLPECVSVDGPITDYQVLYATGSLLRS